MIRALAALLALLAAPALAQAPRGEPASLVADSLLVTADDRLVAEGNVQAFQGGLTLSAARLTYDRAADRLLIEGPILIRDASGAIVTAERAELDPRLEQGILRGARVVLDRQLQLAAARADRIEGRYTALTAAVATSCQVCPGAAPLWEIRAAQVVHDAQEQMIHVRDATFRVRGVPIGWLPALRLPDPSNARATGVLFPSLRTTDRLGAGLRLPVFLELGRSRDVTLTPYLSPGTRTLEARYRQAFLAGDLALRGAVSDDDLLGAGLRGLLAAEGGFDAGDRVKLAFAGQWISDDSYLSDYGYGDEDRLENVVRITRVGESSLLAADLTHYQSLRDDELEGALPPGVATLSWSRRLPLWGGTATLGAGAESFVRTSEGSAERGRDVSRAGAALAWQGDAVLGPGLLLGGEGRLALDGWRVADDAAFDPTLTRAAPAVAATLRWPLLRRGAASSDLVEPVLSLGWAAALGDEPPNEDATLVELDGGNLAALDRLPGEDVAETGGRLSLGVTWTHDAAGYASSLSAGHVLRTEALDVPEASGLAGSASDLLLAGRLDLDTGLTLGARTLLGETGDEASWGKTEARLDWSDRPVSLSTAFVYLPADPDEDRERAGREVSFAAGWEPSPRWSLGASGRYDLAGDGPVRAGLELGWSSECVEVDLSLARRYTSSDAVEPSTDLGLSVNLNGFSAGGRSQVAPGACRS